MIFRRRKWKRDIDNEKEMASELLLKLVTFAEKISMHVAVKLHWPIHIYVLSSVQHQVNRM